MSNEPSHAANFDENDYARPNQTWNCGWAREGHACPLGPTRMGICRSAHECAPYRQDDTWACARIKAKGGPCEEGPLPDGTCCRPIQKCQPVRGIMSRRGVVSLSVFAAALGLVLIMVAAPNRTRLISPGPLISAHRQAVDRCEDCHVAGNGRLGDWVHAAWDAQAGKQQSTLCLECHGELGSNALLPHGQSADALNTLRAKYAARPSRNHSLQVAVAKHALGNPVDVHPELACATCHREHHGTADLTSLTNLQCQICHTATFHSFADGHPPLAHYPYERRTRIYFDHQTHFGNHFPAAEGNSRHECRDCHTPDSFGRYMVAKTFEETCAKCHDHQIEDDASPGLLAASIPAVDVETLRTADVEIGHWPSIYPLHVEAQTALAPFYVLISPRRDDLWSLQTKLDTIDLADLSKATPEQLRSVEAFIWAFKESLVEILATGRTGLQADFAASFAALLSDEEIDELAGAVPLEGLATMQRQWLPDVAAEVEARRAGTGLPAAATGLPAAATGLPAAATGLPAAASAEATAHAPENAIVAADDQHRSRLLNSGWYLHSPSMSLRYRPTRHADPLMKTLLGLGVPGRGASSAAVTSEALQESIAAPLSNVHQSLASHFGPGRCTKCHTVDDDTAAGMRVNWLSYKPPLAQQAFTRFNHAPHLTLRTNEACARCHELARDDPADDAILRPEFVSKDWQPTTSPQGFSSDFAQMSKSTCADCHTRELARDRCTTCHNYHVR